MLETLRINSLTGSSIIVMLDKVVNIEEAADGESALVHLVNGKVIQCTDDIDTLHDAIKRLAMARRR